uniref:Uncharacterized protein n=1 Tax=Rhizophora mucronata TaxID=61149 RepID=A0A2P2N0I8_RHIMU
MFYPCLNLSLLKHCSLPCKPLVPLNNSLCPIFPISVRSNLWDD